MPGSRSPVGFLSNSIVGHYRTAAISGLVAGVAAGGTILSCRLAPPLGPYQYYRALLQRLRLQMAIISPFTAAQEINCAAYKVHGWTAADTGGTALTLTAPNAMLNDIADSAPQMSIQVAGTGAITAGTRTVDSNPFLVCLGAQTFTTATAVQAAPFSEEYVLNSDQQFPFNINGAAANYENIGASYGPEGIIVQNGILLGGGGTVRFSFEIEWLEYDGISNVGGLG
jgi:hypothetical protein